MADEQKGGTEGKEGTEGTEAKAVPSVPSVPSAPSVPSVAPSAPKPAAAAAAPAAAKPAPPAKKVYPAAVFNENNGKLLHGTRYWPTEKWKNPWADPGYKKAAALLVGIIIGILALGAVIGEFSPLIDKALAFATAQAAAYGIPAIVVIGVWDLVKVLIVLHVILVNGLFQIWWERKISAHIQTRLGPMDVGGWHGWAQTIADGIKLLLKEDVTPDAADHMVHRLAPAVAIIPAVIAFAPVLFGTDMAAANIDVGVLYIFAIAGISVMGIVMAGWGSGNKFSLLGGLRSAAQLVSYELPRTFSIVPVIMLSGSLALPVIAGAQSGYWLGFVPRWFIFYPVVGQIAFLIFLTASVAETNRVPFDIPEAESELVAGFHTEYSGMKWSIFFLAEYAYVLLASFLAATFFLGGGASPFAFDHLIPSWIWFLAKALALVFCFLWFRWTFPRFRVDRLMDFNWKFLLPWSFVNILFAAFYLLR